MSAAYGPVMVAAFAFILLWVLAYFKTGGRS